MRLNQVDATELKRKRLMDRVQQSRASCEQKEEEEDGEGMFWLAKVCLRLYEVHIKELRFVTSQEVLTLQINVILLLRVYNNSSRNILTQASFA